MSGMVSDIQRFSLHDGPGIRTTVFLKGCNLRCAWCHNPETLHPAAELQLFPDKCIGCGACYRACRAGAHVLEGGERRFLRERCQACGECAATCYAEALLLVGRQMSAEEVLAEVVQDRAFYLDSGGGVTLSGGEPLCQPAFTRALLQRCRDAGLSTALETNLCYAWEVLAPLLPLLDLLMLDIKALDTELHQAWTGSGNARILDNARRLGQGELPLIARTPVIPGVNDTAEEISRIAEFLAPFPHLRYYELLPYHPLGTGKYAGLGQPYRLAGTPRPSDDSLRTLAAAARQWGSEVRVSGLREG